MTESRLLAIETLTSRANKDSKEILILVQQLANCYVKSNRYYSLKDEIDYKLGELKENLDKLLIEIEKGESCGLKK